MIKDKEKIINGKMLELCLELFELFGYSENDFVARSENLYSVSQIESFNQLFLSIKMVENSPPTHKINYENDVIKTEINNKLKEFNKIYSELCNTFMHGKYTDDDEYPENYGQPQDNKLPDLAKKGASLLGNQVYKWLEDKISTFIHAHGDYSDDIFGNPELLELFYKEVFNGIITKFYEDNQEGREESAQRDEQINSIIGKESNLSNYKFHKLFIHNEEWLDRLGYILESKRGFGNISCLKLKEE